MSSKNEKFPETIPELVESMRHHTQRENGLSVPSTAHVLLCRLAVQMLQNTPTDIAIVDEILVERKRQDEKHGGPEHDDLHDFSDFDGFIYTRATPVGRSDLNKTYRQAMIEIAALAIAAVESYDRKTKG
jgi:hypothetical protein